MEKILFILFSIFTLSSFATEVTPTDYICSNYIEVRLQSLKRLVLAIEYCEDLKGSSLNEGYIDGYLVGYNGTNFLRELVTNTSAEGFREGYGISNETNNFVQALKLIQKEDELFSAMIRGCEKIEK